MTSLPIESLSEDQLRGCILYYMDTVVSKLPEPTADDANIISLFLILSSLSRKQLIKLLQNLDSKTGMVITNVEMTEQLLGWYQQFNDRTEVVH